MNYRCGSGGLVLSCVCVDVGSYFSSVEVSNYHRLLHRNHLLSVDLSDTAGVSFQGVLQGAARLHTPVIQYENANKRHGEKRCEMGKGCFTGRLDSPVGRLEPPGQRRRSGGPRE